jgi:CheY-like chemotaxis protein
VLGDETELFQVLVNLVTNARDAMPDGGRLTIRADAVEDALRFEVSDTGCGVDDATRVAMFEPFFTTKDSGTGLGLPTSAAIVKAHGGDLEVRSRPGEGTSIAFVLPAAPAWPGGETPEPGPVEPQPGAGRSVLVVDDEATIRELVAHTLRQAGYRVSAAAGAEALDLLADPARHWDVVVTDVMMPEVSGDGLARLVAAGRPGAAVVLMSGMHPGPGSRAAVAAGAAFLPKPFTPSGLLAAMDRALAVAAPQPDAGASGGGAAAGASQRVAGTVPDAPEPPALEPAETVLAEVIAPALARAVDALTGDRDGGSDGARGDRDGRDGGSADDAARTALADDLSAAAEEAQRRLGPAAGDPRVHRIVGSAASAAMALALTDAAVPTADIVDRLREGLADLAGIAGR